VLLKRTAAAHVLHNGNVRSAPVICQSAAEAHTLQTPAPRRDSSLASAFLISVECQSLGAPNCAKVGERRIEEHFVEA
jgi:hypothetical protein